jgi:monovalent cation/proton antiporter MnhG/PhaG subunit
VKPIAVDLLLTISVLIAWLGCLGLVRLRTALDRLHCATFINVGAGLSLTVAAWVQDGLTSRSWKTAALVLLTLLVGSATSHAVGRAIYSREGDER